jgi:hypothetical protein
MLNLNNVPFVLGGLGDYLERYPLKNYIYINQALQNTASCNENVGFVSAEGLMSNPDNLHFNAQSLYDFGLRYFEEFERLNTRKDSAENSNIKEDIFRSEMELL